MKPDKCKHGNVVRHDDDEFDCLWCEDEEDVEEI